MTVPGPPVPIAPWPDRWPPPAMHPRPDATRTGLLLRSLAALAGLLALWVGCSVTNAPLHLGGPMNLSYNLPLGVPLVALGTAGVALAPRRAWPLAWPLAAVVALATAGANLWEHPPINDGAFQSLRTGVRDPDRAPADPFLHPLALAPVGIALAALLPGPRRTAPLLLAAAAAALAAGVALEWFEDALLAGDTAARAVILAVPAALLGLAAVRGGHPVGRAVAGQATVLLALCLLLWAEWGGGDVGTGRRGHVEGTAGPTGRPASAPPPPPHRTRRARRGTSGGPPPEGRGPATVPGRPRPTSVPPRPGRPGGRGWSRICGRTRAGSPR